jgi:hypothetical protein
MNRDKLIGLALMAPLVLFLLWFVGWKLLLVAASIVGLFLLFWVGLMAFIHG